jgi:hypothetical protein
MVKTLGANKFQTFSKIVFPANISTLLNDYIHALEDIKKEIESEYEGYEKISGKACVITKNRGIELKEPNPMKKMMMWGSIKMSTLTDGSRAHIAEMMIQGTVMGITSLKTTESKAECTDEEICQLLRELIVLEEKYEKKLKSFL